MTLARSAAAGYRCILLDITTAAGHCLALVFSLSRKVDDEQLVYLQNLILVSNEAVTDAFGVYEEDQDPVRLAESLKKVCVCVCV